MLTSILKRGIAHLQSFPSAEYLAKLRANAELYEQAGHKMEINPVETLPVLVTIVFVAIVLGLMRYTLGDVVGSLAMIESSSPPIALVDGEQQDKDKLPAYIDADEEPLIAISDAEMSITTAPKRITHSLCMTLRHLRLIGGPFAYWRGAHISILYGLAYAFVSNILSAIFGPRLAAIVSPVLLVRLHMLWTHSMIAYPSTKSFWQRIVPRAQCKPLLLPTLVYATAQQATFFLPLVLATLLFPNFDLSHTFRTLQGNDCAQLASLMLRALAVPLSAALLAFFVLLPAAATLTRVEALLLPEDTQSVVAFDRAAILGNIDITPRGSGRALFVAAWRSFDMAARLRMLKLYAKMVGLQTFVMVLGMFIVDAAGVDSDSESHTGRHTPVLLKQPEQPGIDGDSKADGGTGGAGLGPVIDAPAVNIDNTAKALLKRLETTSFCQKYGLGDEICKLLTDEGYETVNVLFEENESEWEKLKFKAGHIAEFKWAMKKMLVLEYPEIELTDMKGKYAPEIYGVNMGPAPRRIRIVDGMIETSGPDLIGGPSLIFPINKETRRRMPHTPLEEFEISENLRGLLKKHGFCTIGGLFEAYEQDLQPPDFKRGHISVLKAALRKVAAQ